GAGAGADAGTQTPPETADAGAETLPTIADAGAQAPAAIVIAPSTAQLIAGSAPVEFTATLSGATGAIAWSLDGPGHLSTTTGTAVTYTPPAEVPGATGATLPPPPPPL